MGEHKVSTPHILKTRVDSFQIWTALHSPPPRCCRRFALPMWRSPASVPVVFVMWTTDKQRFLKPVTPLPCLVAYSSRGTSTNCEVKAPSTRRRDRRWDKSWTLGQLPSDETTALDRLNWSHRVSMFSKQILGKPWILGKSEKFSVVRVSRVLSWPGKLILFVLFVLLPSACWAASRVRSLGPDRGDFEIQGWQSAAALGKQQVLSWLPTKKLCSWLSTVEGVSTNVAHAFDFARWPFHLDPWTDFRVFKSPCNFVSTNELHSESNVRHKAGELNTWHNQHLFQITKSLKTQQPACKA